MKRYILIAAWCIASASLSTQAMLDWEIWQLPLTKRIMVLALDGGKVFPPSAAVVEEKDGEEILEVTLQREAHFSGESSKLKSISATYVEESLLEAFNAEYSGKKRSDQQVVQGFLIRYHLSEERVDTITFTFSLDDYSDEFIDTLCHKLIYCPKTWN